MWQICKYCSIDYDQNDPEWIRWVNEPGFCSDDHYRAFEGILEVGEDEYYILVAEHEEDTNYG